MKRLLMPGLNALLLFLMTCSAYGADAPHNASNNIGCEDCHPQGPGGPYADALCLSCHNNATGGGYTKNGAPRMLAHSSGNTSDQYGNWTTECRTCHSKHEQDQVSAYGPSSYLVTGTIASVSDNGDGTTTFGYMNPVEHISGWADHTTWNKKSGGNASGGNERGLILFANTVAPGVNFEVLSASASAVTVKGSVDSAFPGAVSPGDTFALAYGQLMRSAIVTSGSGTRSVVFHQNVSAESFAYNNAAVPGAPDPSPDGICQVCHTRTAFWRSDGSETGHYGGTNCTQCHRHEAGFKTGCDTCHNAPPATGAHAGHTRSAGPRYTSTKNDPTPTAYGYSCATCHQGTHMNTTADPRTVQVVFSGAATQDGATNAKYFPSSFSVDDPGMGYTFNYSDGTCSSTYCHGNYPGSGRKASVDFTTGTAPCGSCHGASNSLTPDSGSHQSHASAAYGRNYSCSLCHEGIISGSGPDGYIIGDRTRHANGFVDWKFDLLDFAVSSSSFYSLASGSFMPSDGANPRFYGTCGNVYCHSIAQTATGGQLTGAPGEYAATPRWGLGVSGSRFCGPCHKNGSHHNNGSPAAIDSGSHEKHLSYQFNAVKNNGMRSYKCAVCHRYDQQVYGSYNSCDACHTTTALYEKHVNGIVDMRFDSSFGDILYNDGTPDPGRAGNGFFSCSNSYCHSNGTSLSTNVIPANTSPGWGSGVLACDACHGNPPSYVNEAPKKNSHAAHSGEPCNVCHLATTANGSTIASTAAHVNKQYDVGPDAGVSFAYLFSPNGGTCSDISCHGSGSAQWGGSIPCQDCHSGTADLDDFSGTFYANGTPSRIGIAGEWDTTGHGRTNGNYASGNPAASFTSQNACLYCHDAGISHKNAANPFRLRNTDHPAWGLNGVCQACHATASAGASVDSVLRNGAKKVDSSHYGAKHDAGSGGRFCWDCHDPHGDANLFMVQASVAKTSDAATGAPLSLVTTSFITTATGTGYAKSAAPFDGICNVCHAATDHYTATSGDGHNADVRCTTCHQHSSGTINEAFRAACDSCHGNPPVDGTSLAGFVVPSNTGSTTAGAHGKHVAGLAIGCGACHANSSGSGSTHANGDLTVSLGFSLFDGAYEGGVYDGQTTVSYNSSAPSTTVTSGGLKECSNLYCHGSTMAPNGGDDLSPVWDNPATADCGSCHGASPAHAPRRGAHLRHAGPYTDIGHEYPCSFCHQDPSVDPSLHVNNRSEVALSTHPSASGGVYSGTPAVLDAYGSCTNVYCHSNVQTSPPGGPLTYRTINWSQQLGADMGCNACHGGPGDHYVEPLTGINSGSHVKHAAYTLYCATCHASDITQDPDPGTFGFACFACHTPNGPNVTHANHAVDVNMVTKYGGSYTGTPVPGDAYGSCSATYCHSNGTSVATGAVPANVSPSWGDGGLACDACHGYPPAYANGSPKKNSHAAHAAEPCAKCHVATTTNGNTIANTSVHVNKKYDVAPQAASGVSFTYTYSANGGTCAGISCHGGGSATWGGTLP